MTPKAAEAASRTSSTSNPAYTRYKFLRAVALTGQLQRMVIFTMLDQCHTEREFDESIDRAMASGEWLPTEAKPEIR
jgi:hypothetical protein